MTYAVIRTGGKQYRVAKDDVIAVERLAGDVGGKVAFTDILMLGTDGKAPKIGAPIISGAKVEAEVLEQGRADKINIIKFKRRKKYRRAQGHRQDQTWVKITNIAGAATAAKTEAKKEEA